MEFRDKLVDLDENLIAQSHIKDFLISPTKGLISELLLYKLLKIADVAIRNELKKVGFDGQLIGLRLGYILRSKDNLEIEVEPVARDAVSWGLLLEDEPLAEVEVSVQENFELNNNTDSVNSEFLDKLVKQLESAIVEGTPPVKLNNLRLNIELSWNTDKCSAETTCVFENGKCYKTKKIFILGKCKPYKIECKCN